MVPEGYRYPLGTYNYLSPGNLWAYCEAICFLQPERGRCIPARRLSLLLSTTPDGRPLPLRVAEIELSVFIRQGFSKRIATQECFPQQVKQWIKQRNDKRDKVDWQFKTQDARIKIDRLYASLYPMVQLYKYFEFSCISSNSLTF